MKWQTIDLLTHNIGFHAKLQTNAMTVRRMNAVLGSGKSLYAEMHPAIFTDDGEGKLLLVARHWSFDIARSRALMGDEKTKTPVLMVEKGEVAKVLDLDAVEIAALSKIKMKAPNTKKKTTQAEAQTEPEHQSVLQSQTATDNTMPDESSSTAQSVTLN